MSVVLKITFCMLLGALCATCVETQSLTEETQEKDFCHMCHELKGENQLGDLLEEQFEKDKKDVKWALKDIEESLNEIGGRVWWLPKSDVDQMHNESQAVLTALLKKTLSLDDVGTKVGIVKNKLEVFEAEKATNKAKAVEQWRMVFAIRQRLYNLEKVLLDVVVLAEDLPTVSRIDKLRALANTIAQKLKEVTDYYGSNIRVIQTVSSNLKEIDEKMSELKPASTAGKKKCAFLFFFCK